MIGTDKGYLWSYAKILDKTDAQVLWSRSGDVIGAAELIVTTEKVGIERLQVDIVAGVSLTVDAKVDQPRTLAVHVTESSQLSRKYQVGCWFAAAVFASAVSCIPTSSPGSKLP